MKPLKGEIASLVFSPFPLAEKSKQNSQLKHTDKIVVDIQMDFPAPPTDGDWQNWRASLKKWRDGLKVETERAGHPKMKGAIWLLRNLN